MLRSPPREGRSGAAAAVDQPIRPELLEGGLVCGDGIRVRLADGSEISPEPEPLQILE